MAAQRTDQAPVNLSESSMTMPSIPSDSDNYAANNELSSSPASSDAPVILYKPPTFWGIVRGAAINLVLPFINGLMLGLGELLAHEAAFRLGWGGTKVFPSHRARPIGAGIEVQEDSSRRRRRGRNMVDLDDVTALE